MCLQSAGHLGSTMNVYQVKKKRRKRTRGNESEHSFREFCCKEKQRNGEGSLAGRLGSGGGRYFKKEEITGCLTGCLEANKNDPLEKRIQ